MQVLYQFLVVNLLVLCEFFLNYLFKAFFSIIYFFVCLCFTACQDYFTHFEQSQSLGEAKMGDRRKKSNLTTHKQNLVCLMWPKLGSNPQRWDDKRFRSLKISCLNHSAMQKTFFRYWRMYFLSLVLWPSVLILFLRANPIWQVYGTKSLRLHLFHTLVSLQYLYFRIIKAIFRVFKFPDFYGSHFFCPYKCLLDKMTLGIISLRFYCCLYYKVFLLERESIWEEEMEKIYL